ncbi:PLC-like phosphodiesterase, partial [Saccharata proteae CBS 121410]
GGYIDLVNGSPYTWQLAAHTSYQMATWSFPTTITSGQSSSVYVEWEQGLGKDQNDDGGEANYTLEGTSAGFQVQARNPDGFNIQVLLSEIETENNPLGTTISLGWNHDKSVNFVLSGTDGSYSSNNPSVDWMQQNLDTLGDRTLRHLCMPGSHDSGMSTFGTHTGLVTAANTLTQTFNISEQLMAGSRWFDIRPVVSGGDMYTGHYSNTNVVGWQGADGQSIADVISDINSFTAQYHELIILDVSHAYDTDNSYVDFSQDQWNTLFTQLAGLNNRLNTTDLSTTDDLTQRTLSQYIGNGAACVLVVAELPSGISLSDDYFAQGIVNSGSSFSFYNEYADTDNLTAMELDQISKLASNRATPDDTFFLLSWTLTESAVESVWGDIPIPGGFNTILALAGSAYEPLFNSFGNFTAQSYPNVLYMDLMGATFDADATTPNTDIAALAMAVNN